MSQQSCLITLFLHGNEINWSWDVTETGSDISMPSRTISIPQRISPAALYEKIFDNFKNSNLIDYIHVQKIGTDLVKGIFPSELVDRLKNAAQLKGSSINFKVPLEWANIPFDLCYLPKLGFLGHLFCIGTKILIETPRKDNPPRNKMLIITDSTERACEEGEKLKEKARENNWEVHVLSQGTPSKILLEMKSATIVHYAGDVPEKDNGWRLGSGQVFDISDMQRLGGHHFVPGLIFSNSCHSGNYNYSNDYNLSGIAGTFLEAGVSQVIGTVDKVNDNEAKEFALLFYNGIFKGKSPAESLLAAKKERVKGSTDSATPLLYRLFGHPLYNMGNGGFINIFLKMLHKFKMFLGIVFFFMICLLIYFVIIGRFCTTLGFTDYRSEPDIKKLEEYLEDKICRPAKERLPFYKRLLYTFKVKVIPGKYLNIFSELKEKKIDIAFVSPFCYLYVKYLDPNRLEGLECIGVKIVQSRETYRSGFLVRKDSGIHTLDDINENTVASFIHGDSLSTSTYSIPYIFLLEHGLTKVPLIGIPERWIMIEKIKNSKADERFIGALSNEDWDKINDGCTDSLRYIPIENIPIPYDAVFRNKDSHFNNKDWEAILNALNDSIKKMMPYNWEERHSNFVDYIASGIITGKYQNNTPTKECVDSPCYTVFLPEKGRDLYRLNEAMSVRKSVIIYRFKGERGDYYALEKIKAGDGKLTKINNPRDYNEALLLDTKTNPSLDDLVGLHVLLEPSE